VGEANDVVSEILRMHREMTCVGGGGGANDNAGCVQLRMDASGLALMLLFPRRWIVASFEMPRL
jgi:hypothetical protein